MQIARYAETGAKFSFVLLEGFPEIIIFLKLKIGSFI